MENEMDLTTRLESQEYFKVDRKKKYKKFVF